MVKNIIKTALKRKKIQKKKRTTLKKVPKTNTKEQSVLKNLFVTQRSGTKKISSGAQRTSTSPPCQQVWRRTVLRNKPKPKPREKLPRLFRMDDKTGLPMDYEKTVERVMHYVNPHLNSRPNAELVMEDLLTNMLMDLVHKHCPFRKVPADMCCRDHQTKRYLQSFLKSDDCESDQPTKQSKYRANADLTDFHSACKRGPRQISPKLGPTKASKFNFNQLKIRSQ